MDGSPNAQFILEQFSQALLPELRTAAGSHFGPTIESHIDANSLTIDASPFINVLIDGRGPTSAGAKRGTPTLQQSLLDWINKHNIQPRTDKQGNTPSLESLSWAMANSIHLHGTLLYQRGGGNNIFDNIITQSRLDALLSQFGEVYLNLITTQSLNKLEQI